MEIKRKFDCSCCGLCCRNLDKNPYLENTELCGSDGVCIYLDRTTNLCTIYDSRPLICRVDDLYDSKYKDKISRSEYYKLCHKICKILKDFNMGMDLS